MNSYYYFDENDPSTEKVLISCHGSVQELVTLNAIINLKRLFDKLKLFFDNHLLSKNVYIEFIYTGNPLQFVIDRQWNFIIARHFNMNLTLERNMWNLSTFGGAFSSLGDYYNRHAIIAGRLSMTQFQLAKEMGNDDIMVRCKLYFLLSLAQLGKPKTAIKFITYEYNKAQIMKNNFLMDCAEGTIAKIKSLQVIKKNSTIEHNLLKI
uniref:Uncharacterized protein n=1 Tax=Rhabditophanes sp. KR3021 TaxID=114890 RepID=A0AC35TPQ1_9BILA